MRILVAVQHQRAVAPPASSRPGSSVRPCLCSPAAVRGGGGSARYTFSLRARHDTHGTAGFRQPQLVPCIRSCCRRPGRRTDNQRWGQDTQTRLSWRRPWQAQRKRNGHRLAQSPDGDGELWCLWTDTDGLR